MASLHVGTQRSAKQAMDSMLTLVQGPSYLSRRRIGGTTSAGSDQCRDRTVRKPGEDMAIRSTSGHRESGLVKMNDFRLRDMLDCPGGSAWETGNRLVELRLPLLCAFVDPRGTLSSQLADACWSDKPVTVRLMLLEGSWGHLRRCSSWSLLLGCPSTSGFFSMV
ncbi:hypothetical protein NM208_g16178 [Fusarium decemcellulare]|uniref:Uncharacterized protein n=1 Tax=Fusarium decemcellulare TaxID=57161 RepID=A0ACC1RCP5_9HYPO|nr:hypothetical protein NM208_g16178 [Fusarium decemcellulare]